jgi:hypothetical protein
MPIGMRASGGLHRPAISRQRLLARMILKGTMVGSKHVACGLGEIGENGSPPPNLQSPGARARSHLGNRWAFLPVASLWNLQDGELLLLKKGRWYAQT